MFSPQTESRHFASQVAKRQILLFQTNFNFGKKFFALFLSWILSWVQLLKYLNHFEIKLSWLLQMAASKNVKVSAKAPVVFGNIDEIYNFHSETLIPQLENCNNRWSIFMVKTFHSIFCRGKHSFFYFHWFPQNVSDKKTKLLPR